jgi:hypothetical protein
MTPYVAGTHNILTVQQALEFLKTKYPGKLFRLRRHMGGPFHCDAITSVFSQHERAPRGIEDSILPASMVAEGFLPLTHTYDCYVCLRCGHHSFESV